MCVCVCVCVCVCALMGRRPSRQSCFLVTAVAAQRQVGSAVAVMAGRGVLLFALLRAAACVLLRCWAPRVRSAPGVHVHECECACVRVRLWLPVSALGCISKPNPRNTHWGTMKLYLKKQVVGVALRRWGSLEAVHEEVRGSGRYTVYVVCRCSAGAVWCGGVCVPRYQSPLVACSPVMLSFGDQKLKRSVKRFEGGKKSSSKKSKATAGPGDAEDGDDGRT